MKNKEKISNKWNILLIPVFIGFFLIGFVFSHILAEYDILKLKTEIIEIDCNVSSLDHVIYNKTAYDDHGVNLEFYLEDIVSKTHLENAVCRHYTEYYNTYFNDQWDQRNFTIQAYESPVINLCPNDPEGCYHIFAIVTANHQYCIIDQHMKECFDFRK